MENKSKNIKEEEKENDDIYFRYKKVNLIGLSGVGKKTLINEFKKYNNPLLQKYDKIKEKEEINEEIKEEVKEEIKEEKEEKKEYKIESKIILNLSKLDISLKDDKTIFHLNIYISNLDDLSIIEKNKDSLLYESELIILMLDVTSQKSFIEINNFLKYLEINNEKNNIYKFLILSNKIDKYSEREVSSYELNELSEKNNNIYLSEISLLSKENFSLFLKSIKNILYENPEFNVNDLIMPQNPPLISINNNIYSGIINIMILGNSSVGKTSFIRRFFKNNFMENTISTFGIDVEKTIIKFPHKYYQLKVWDTAGQEKFRTIPKKYYSKGDGFFILFDLTDQNTFIEVNKWIEDIRETLGNNNNNDNQYKNIPIYLLGNKIDKINRVVQRNEAEDFAQKNQVKYEEISCKYGFNIYEVMINMIFDASQKIGDMETFFLESKTNEKNGKKKKNVVLNFI